MLYVATRIFMLAGLSGLASTIPPVGSIRLARPSHHMAVRSLQYSAIDRRTVIKLALAASIPGAWRSGHALAQPALAADPFSLGVASAPSGPGAVVLWTRIVPGLDAQIARFSKLATEDYVAARRSFV